MKRNLDLIKSILEYFECKDDWNHEKDLEIENYDSKIVSYHIQIMYEAGLLNGEAVTSNTGRIYDVIPFRLTWQGHEFLDNIKDKNRWKKIKQIVLTKGGNFSIEIVKNLAIKLAEHQLLNN
jgi:hypothetical protein